MSKQKIETLVEKPELSFYENDETFRILDIDVETSLDSKISSIEDYMKDNDGVGKTDEEKDLMYANAQTLYFEYTSELKEAKFNFYFNRPQYKLLTDLLLKKLEFDVNTLFIGLELDDMLRNMHGTKFKNDEELKLIKLTATELTYMYHLIQGYKVKGLTSEARSFASLLTRIGEVSKVINFYDAKAKTLNTEIQHDWALSLDGNGDLLNELEEKSEEKSEETLEKSDS